MQAHDNERSNPGKTRDRSDTSIPDETDWMSVREALTDESPTTPQPERGRDMVIAVKRYRRRQIIRAAAVFSAMVLFLLALGARAIGYGYNCHPRLLAQLPGR